VYIFELCDTSLAGIWRKGLAHVGEAMGQIEQQRDQIWLRQGIEKGLEREIANPPAQDEK
jgi:hypothetical protein